MGARGPRKTCEIVKETLERAVLLVEMRENQCVRMMEWAESPVVRIQERAKAEAYRDMKEALQRLIEVSAPPAEAAA